MGKKRKRNVEEVVIPKVLHKQKFVVLSEKEKEALDRLKERYFFSKFQLNDFNQEEILHVIRSLQSARFKSAPQARKVTYYRKALFQYLTDNRFSEFDEIFNDAFRTFSTFLNAYKYRFRRGPRKPVYLSEEDKEVLEQLKQGRLFPPESLDVVLSGEEEIINTVIELEMNRFQGKRASYVHEINAYRKLMFESLGGRATEYFEFTEFCRLVNNRKNNGQQLSVYLSDKEKAYLQKLKKRCSSDECFHLSFLSRQTVIEAVLKLECLHFQGESTISTVAIQKFRGEVVDYLVQGEVEYEAFKNFSMSVSKEKLRIKELWKKMSEKRKLSKEETPPRKRVRYEIGHYEIRELLAEQEEVQGEEYKQEDCLLHHPKAFICWLDTFLVNLEDSVNSLLQQEAVQFFNFVDEGFFHSVSTFFPYTYNEDEEKETSLFSVITNVDQVLQQLRFMMKSSCSHFEMDGFSKLEKSFSDLRLGWGYQNKLSDISSAFSSEERVKQIRDLFDKSSSLRRRIDTKKEQIMTITESQMRCNDEENLRLTV
ncbi:MAG: hypothetical protein ABIH77_04500 [Pseudomonadota bacterium]